MTAILLHERSTPSVGHVLARCLARCAEADFALTRIRLAGVDLTGTDLDSVRRWRVLVGRLDAEAFAHGHADEDRDAIRRRLATLETFVLSGKLEVRAAGIAAWAPDFSVLRGLDGKDDDAVTLLGPHYFLAPQVTGGPSLTAVFHNGRTAREAGERFEELWEKGYDVGAVVAEALSAMRARVEAR